MAIRPTLVAAALAAAMWPAATPVHAEQFCHSVRVDLINDWVYCVNVTVNPDGSVTVGVECDMAQNACPNPSITVP